MRKIFISVAAILSPVAIAENNKSDASVSAEVELLVDFENAEELTSSRTYSVIVEGNRRDSRDDVYEKALLKASKMTLREDFEWFRVLDSDVDRETVGRDRPSSRIGTEYERTPVKRCGLLGCTTRYETSQRTRIESDFPERRDRVYEVSLDFKMGVGPVTEGGSVYDARNIRDERR